MDKQAVIGFILIGVVLVVWMYFNAPDPQQQSNQSGRTDSTFVQTDSTEQNIPEKDTVQIPTEPETEQIAAIDSTNALESVKKGDIITIETPLAIYEMNTKGGKYYKIFLRKFNNWYFRELPPGVPYYREKVQLLNADKGGSFDIEFITQDGKLLNTANLIFDTESQNYKYTITENDSLTLRFTYNIDAQSYIQKSYTIYGNKYGTSFDLDMVNMHDVISNSTYDLVWGSGIRFVEKNSVDEANYSNASLHYGDEQVIIDAPGSEGEVEKEEFNGRVDWVTVRNKYFSAIISPDNPNETEGAYFEAFSKNLPDQGINEFYSARLKMQFPNSVHYKQSFLVYMGPVSYDLLETYGKNLTKVVDFGSFLGLKFIVRPIAEFILLPLFNFLHSFIPNYGVVIIVFSFIIKLVVYPLTKQSYKSMKKMQLLQPKIKELKEKYADDPQKVNSETMKLYSTYGVNPAGGCLPLLLQMPIFVALWGLFQTAIELRQQPFMLWITDLSRPDIVMELDFALPLIGIKHISGLAVLMGITTFLQQKMTVKDPQQKAMIYIMPVFLTLLFMSFPSGLCLYYFLFNVLSIGQQWIINKTGTEAELVPVKKDTSKKGFFHRMMDAAEQQQKIQKQGKKKRKF